MRNISLIAKSRIIIQCSYFFTAFLLLTISFFLVHLFHLIFFCFVYFPFADRGLQRSDFLVAGDAVFMTWFERYINENRTKSGMKLKSLHLINIIIKLSRTTERKWNFEPVNPDKLAIITHAHSPNRFAYLFCAPLTCAIAFTRGTRAKFQSNKRISTISLKYLDFLCSKTLSCWIRCFRLLFYLHSRCHCFDWTERDIF